MPHKSLVTDQPKVNPGASRIKLMVKQPEGLFAEINLGLRVPEYVPINGLSGRPIVNTQNIKINLRRKFSEINRHHFTFKIWTQR